MLSAYVPRVMLDWLRDEPATTWRALDATLVFVDVSGFTALSERLAQLGRIGAEELTDTINTCFAALLKVAYTGGGSLLKFGGDALLLLFSGDQHVARGCRAAEDMRAALAALGSLQTSVGPITLQMSIGIESGEVDLFLLGDSHRELVVGGPVATATVAMESVAGAGQIVIGPGVGRALDPALLGAEVGPGRLLTAAPEAPRRDPATLPKPTAASLVAQGIPLALRAALTESDGGAEHRRVSVAFLRFLGLDALVVDEGGLSAAAALGELVRVVQGAADQHGVTFLASDIDRDGGKLILVTGAPTSEGNDQERLLLALRDIIEHPTRLAVSVGVHSGEVFVGDVGPAYRRAYTVMGDVVNLAARLMARSLPRSILATDDLLAGSRTLFRTDPLLPFEVKGKSQPVTAFAVGPATGIRAAGQRGELPFAGREAELATFASIMATALEGTGRLVDVVGEAGIGKSRLLEAFRAATTDRRVIELVGELHRASTPYATIRKLLREELGAPPDATPTAAAQHLLAVLEAERPDLVEWAPLLAIAYGTELPATAATRNLDEQFLRPRLHEVVLELLRWRWDEPVLLTIEDAQWLDEASADVLHALAVELAEQPWVVCTSRRSQDEDVIADVPVTTIALVGLDDDTLVELARTATEQTPMSTHDLELIVERSGGNPLFLQELIVAARDSGGVDALPGSIESLVTARIDRLPTAQRELLREASVLGYSFPRHLAAAVLSDGRADELDTAADFLSVDGEVVRFRHAMIRDASYAGLPYRRRRQLHAVAGDTIAATDPDRVELLSFHYHLAGRADDAWSASVRAGNDALTLYANNEAATFFRRGLEVAPRVTDLHDVEVARVAEALGDTLLRVGELDAAAATYRAASSAVRDEVVLWSRLVLKGARVRAQLKDYPQALRDITRALRRLDGVDGAEARAQRAQLMVWYGHLRLEQGRPADAIDWSERALAEAEQAGDRDALGHAYRLLDWAYVDLGRPDEARYSDRAIALYEELDDLPNQASVLNNLGGIAYWSGNWREALTYYERANELDARVGDVIGAAMGRNNIAEILADQGRWGEAAELFREVERALRAANFGVAIAYVRSNLGRTYARAGRYDDAEVLLEDARRESAEIGAATQVVEAEARLAELNVFRGRPDAALAILEDAQRRSDAKEGVAAQAPLLHRLRGYAHAQRGAYDDARAELELSLHAAESRDADYERALAEQALADLAEFTGEVIDAAVRARTAQTLDTLGVERLPVVPLRVTAEA